MDTPDSTHDETLVDLLVAYDEGLINGDAKGLRLQERLSAVPIGVRLRFDRAKACLLLVERVWPRTQPQRNPYCCGGISLPSSSS